VQGESVAYGRSFLIGTDHGDLVASGGEGIGEYPHTKGENAIIITDQKLHGVTGTRTTQTQIVHQSVWRG
jgi:hypothetical protein